MKDKRFKLPYLNPSLAFHQPVSSSLTIIWLTESFMTWFLLTSLFHLLINDPYILFIQTGNGARNLGYFGIWDSCADENILKTELFFTMGFHALDNIPGARQEIFSFFYIIGRNNFFHLEYFYGIAKSYVQYSENNYIQNLLNKQIAQRSVSNSRLVRNVIG